MSLLNLIMKISKCWLLCCSLVFIGLTWILPANAGVLSNENMTISVGNEKSWTGRNGTGNLSYYGCDRACDCIYLTGGKITCRNGVCKTVWQYENSSYVLSSPIAQVSAYGNTPSTLTVASDSKTVMTAQLYPKPFDNLESSP